ncbi:MAG: trigger factor [Lentimonas sp.]|jgi:trigger factor
MSTIKTEVHEINETRKEVSVDVAAAEIANIHKQLVNEFQREAKIPGFRSGKAPENVILTRFAKELKSELAKRVINMAYQEGVGKLDFEVFSVVESNEVEVAPDKNVSVSFTVDVLQEFELPDYEGLKLTVKPTEPTAEEIDTVVKQMLSQRAEFNTVEKTVEKGDYVKCSYEGKIGEELIAEIVPDKPMWGTQKNTWEEAGTDQPYGVPVIIEGLVGMKAGDKKEVPMDFPEDFEFEALAGKKGIYSVEVEEVREKILPEMDEAFFKSMQLKDEAELRTRISENLENQKKQQNLNVERQQITDQLLKSVDFAIPESGIESERDAVLRDFMQRNMKQGASESDFEANKEKLHEEAGKAASSRLKTRLILNKIAQKENIKVDNDDFGRLIMLEAQQTGQKPEKIVKEIQKDQNRLNSMRSDILLQKTLDLILEKAERETVAESPETVGTAET